MPQVTLNVLKAQAKRLALVSSKQGIAVRGRCSIVFERIGDTGYFTYWLNGKKVDPARIEEALAQASLFDE